MARSPLQIRRLSWRLRTGLALLLGASAAAPLAAQSANVHTGLAPRVVAPDSGQRRILPDGRAMLLKVGPANGGASYLFLGSEDLPPGTGIPRHRHEVDEELLIVLRGRLTVALNDSLHEAPAGSVVYLPPRVWVAVTNRSTETATLMFVFPRGAVERCFQFIGRAPGESTPRRLTRPNAPRSCGRAR